MKKKYNRKMLTFKSIIVGESGVGKTSLMIQGTKNQKYQRKIQSTVGVQFGSKIFEIQDKKVKLEIWDTGGQQKYRAVVKNFYRNSSAILIVYNVCDKSTFQQIQQWITQARQHSKKSALIILIGTHIDLIQMRQVSKEQAIRYGSLNKIDFFRQVSLKTGENVDRIFQEIGILLFQAYDNINQLLHKQDQFPKNQSQISMDDSIHLHNKQPTSCCRN